MLKQFLSKIPGKSSKADSIGSPRRETNQISSSRGGQAASNLQRTTSGTVFSSRTAAAAANAVKRTPSGTVFPSSVVAGVEPLLSFKDVPSSERNNLLISKLSFCSIVFDFNDPTKCIQEKELKRATLIDLVDFVASTPPNKFTEQAIMSLCKMCANNLFRAFPPNLRSTSSSRGNEVDDDEPMFDPAWSHLQLVYELLLKFVTSPSLEAKVAKKYLNHSFISKLLDLFDSEDLRERECLKTILHRLYGKFMVHRPFIRKSMSNVFYRFVFETERHYGIPELLEIFGSVISGFAVPLKEEHKMFLSRALIPLHKPKSLGIYFQQLSYCVSQFIEKEPKLASIVIRGLLKHWPITNSQKEVLFLGEIEEILEVISMGEFQKVMAPLFWRIGCCINSCHFQVAERALFFWNNDQILNLIAHNRHVILPIIFPFLERNTKDHWNESVHNFTLSLRKMFIEMDDALFMDCEAHFRDEQEKISLEEEQRKEKWECLENMASLKPVTGKIAVLVTPFASSITLS
ncbi:serine/threonine protein phosphatase 2A 57 kDa regulatory subunit B' kappa isoform-like [Impatiens glandulifera]|uniref:serine/threonine protein phosphatase 2A 57 kDa regulatory subunit B' kappa isoform-like n=1 Tax=Impatiens glandulifera TaxID=253017 RepID=UPI001FB0BBDE|nr:serine/threonine protein phosphatase 2A 57 kDa regulatory subunit B' kappa isoform-like [Impatiens glandulifera]